MAISKQTTAFEDIPPAYVLSTEVEDVAREVIADHNAFRELGDPAVVRIGYAFRTDSPVADDDGIDDIISVTKASPLWACLSDYDLVIAVKDDYWRRHQPEHAALVTHALSHVLITEDGKIKKVGHDVEAFHREAMAYGAWRPNISKFQSALAIERPSAHDPDKVADLADHAKRSREGRDE